MSTQTSSRRNTLDYYTVLIPPRSKENVCFSENLKIKTVPLCDGDEKLLKSDKNNNITKFMVKKEDVEVNTQPLVINPQMISNNLTSNMLTSSSPSSNSSPWYSSPSSDFLIASPTSPRTMTNEKLEDDTDVTDDDSSISREQEMQSVTTTSNMLLPYCPPPLPATDIKRATNNNNDNNNNNNNNNNKNNSNIKDLEIVMECFGTLLQIHKIKTSMSTTARPFWFRDTTTTTTNTNTHNDVEMTNEDCNNDEPKAKRRLFTSNKRNKVSEIIALPKWMTEGNNSTPILTLQPKTTRPTTTVIPTKEDDDFEEESDVDLDLPDVTAPPSIKKEDSKSNRKRKRKKSSSSSKSKKSNNNRRNKKRKITETVIPANTFKLIQEDEDNNINNDDNTNNETDNNNNNDNDCTPKAEDYYLSEEDEFELAIGTISNNSINSFIEMHQSQLEASSSLSSPSFSNAITNSSTSSSSSSSSSSSLTLPTFSDMYSPLPQSESRYSF